MNLGRKLHVTIGAHGVDVAVCQLDEVQRPARLLESHDGVVAMETHTVADDKPRWRWLIIGRAKLGADARAPLDAARATGRDGELVRCALYSLARAARCALVEPDVCCVILDEPGAYFRKALEHRGRGAFVDARAALATPLYLERPINPN